jgi:hypothetical protein
VNYYWTVCPKCSCEVTIQYAERADGLSGSLRRWSTGRDVNDGRRLDVMRGDLSPEGGFQTPCVCGESIAVDPAGVERATTERG